MEFIQRCCFLFFCFSFKIVLLRLLGVFLSISHRRLCIFFLLSSRSHRRGSYVLCEDTFEGRQWHSINKVGKTIHFLKSLSEKLAAQSDLGNRFLNHENEPYRRDIINYISHLPLRTGFTCFSPCSPSATNVVLEWHLTQAHSYGPQEWGVRSGLHFNTWLPT